MSVILNNSNLMTIIEANKRKNIPGREEFLINLVQKHKLLDVIPFLPASDGSFHKYTEATSLGKGKWRKANQGRQTTRGSVQTRTTPVQIYSAESVVPEDTLIDAPNPGEVRSSEDLLIAEGIVYDLVDSVINSDGSNPDATKGFEFFRPKLGDYCLNCIGESAKTTGLTSIYVMEVGERGVNIRYNPKFSGSQYGVGLSIQDRGLSRTDAPDGSGKIYAYTTTFDLTAALEVRRQDTLVRLANIDTETEFPAEKVIQAVNLLPNSGSNAVAIVPRAIYAQVMTYALNKNNVNFTVSELENYGQIIRFMGLPLLQEDAISTDLKLVA